MEKKHNCCQDLCSVANFFASYHAPVNEHDYLHFPTREGTINLEKLRLPAKIRAIEKFQSRVSLWTYVGDLEA